MKKSCSLTLIYITTLTITLLILCFGNHAVTVISESQPIASNVSFIIDPGHGGVDGGATSCTGKTESELNLEISLRLRDLFHLLGFRTKIIRTSDISVYTEGETIAQKKISDLRERVRICNETENGVLLSIHQNIFSDGRYSGAQVFYPSTEGSKEFAQKMQKELASTLNPGSKRAAKQASGIYLLEHIHCKGLLIECGFLSNPEEEAKLRSKSYQQKLCCVIAAAAISDLLLCSTSTNANT